MPPDKTTHEEALKSSLEDVVAIAQKLAPFCKDVTELVQLCQHALENDAQLRLLLSLVSKK